MDDYKKLSKKEIKRLNEKHPDFEIKRNDETNVIMITRKKS